jgi:steroid 5-alpha reductase family enzyme
MFDLALYAQALPVLMALTTAVWVLSLVTRDASWIDPFWPVLFLAAGGVFAWNNPVDAAPRVWLVLALLAAWALRLGGYLTWRKTQEEGEDHRYRAMRKNNPETFARRSLVTVFWLQAGLAWIVAAPLLGAMHSGAPLGALDLAGVALWAVGFFFESVGDLQLARFKANPDNKGRVLDSGLWRYTRHPNYFGNFCMWWGWYLLAVSAGGAWSIYGPLFMSFLLLKVSGVALLEKDIGERRPAYARYIRQTNAFFPGPPQTA